MTSASLTGRTEGYRGAAIRCPGCAEAMRIVALPDATADIDSCDACGGLWVDWFDGEVRAVATATLRAGEAGRAPGGARSAPNEPAAIGACPRCARQLVAERVAGAEAAAGLLRCEGCMGAYVSRASAEALASLGLSERPPPSRPAPSVEPLPWQRVVALVRSVLGRSPR